MSTGVNDKGEAYYVCEKCGATQGGHTKDDGSPDERAARTALRVHMILAHNTGY